MSAYPASPRLADRLNLNRREIVATLGLANLGDLERLQKKLGSAFPSFVNGTADRSEILKLKEQLGNPGTSAQPPAPSTPASDRRIGLVDRRT